MVLVNCEPRTSGWASQARCFWQLISCLRYTPAPRHRVIPSKGWRRASSYWWRLGIVGVGLVMAIIPHLTFTAIHGVMPLYPSGGNHAPQQEAEDPALPHPSDVGCAVRETVSR